MKLFGYYIVEKTYYLNDVVDNHYGFLKKSKRIYLTRDDAEQALKSLENAWGDGFYQKSEFKIIELYADMF